MDILERLRADCMGMRRSQLEKLADIIGIAHSTFRRIVAGTGHNYNYSNIRKIEDYYSSLPGPKLTLEVAADARQQVASGQSRRQMG